MVPCMNTHFFADGPSPLRLVLIVLPLILLAALVALSPTGTSASRDNAEKDLVQKGWYLVQVSMCNDCHTAGYADSGGTIPEKDWLTGDAVGWSGPWGTTYPQNLRLFMQGVTEEQWLTIAKTVEYRPPMPWFALRAMSDTDLRSIYRYIRHLGPAGKPAPAYLPPEQQPTGTFFELRNAEKQ